MNPVRVKRAAGSGERRTMLRVGRSVLLILLCLAAAATGQTAQGGGPPLIEILRSELARNMDVLKKEPVPPYFASYAVHDSRSIQIVAAFGALQRTDDISGRAGTVEIRVGDYTLDNTHPLRSGQSSIGPRQPSRVRLPMTDDGPATRAALWRVTDRAFKQAVEALTRVKTNVASTVKEERPAPDFSRETPQVHNGTPATVTLDVKAWEQRLRSVSAAFADDPLIFLGSATLDVDSDTRYYVNSEGSAILTGQTSYQVFLQGMTKADDGMELPLYASYFAPSADELPSEAQLLADARQMAALLGRLRKAPLVDPYTGPAVLSGRASGVFFHEIFGHRIEGHRQKNVDDAQTFAKRVGQPILPAFLSVAFDPTERRLDSQPLVGTYEFDDEGVKARRVQIVENGVLKAFLLSRAPLEAFPQSNGHGRAQPGLAPVSRQSNLFVISSQTVPQDRLMTMLKDEAQKQGKPFGLLFENIEGGFTFTGRTSPNAFNVLPNVVYRVYTDGRPPELVRGVDLIGTPLAAFGKIVATSDRVEVFNGMCGAESGNVPVSASAPALLVSEVEVQKKAQSQETSPILPAPMRKQ
jgi:predicted Zn-dependent protease